MKKALILVFSVFLLIGCNNSTPNTAQVPPPANINTNRQQSNDSLVVSSHSTQKSATPAPATNSTTSSTSGNSPMAKAIDVSEMTAAIEKAEKAYKAKSDDAKLKDALAEAYFKRAFALTEAAQYRAALGDFRKGLKLNPNAKEAKAMHDRIIDIFKSINREPPREGEEPPPMPFNKS